MIDLADFIVSGIISKTHGVHGQVVIQTNDLSFENISKWELVVIEINGLPVPFFIDVFLHRNNNTILLTVDDINTEQKAQELVGKEVFFKRSDIKPKKQNISKEDRILGYYVIDNRIGKLGILDSIINNQYNPLLRVLDGKKEILIPYQAEFIVKVDDKGKTIFVNIPVGLIELFD